MRDHSLSGEILRTELKRLTQLQLNHLARRPEVIQVLEMYANSKPLIEMALSEIVASTETSKATIICPQCGGRFSARDYGHHGCFECG